VTPSPRRVVWTALLLALFAFFLSTLSPHAANANPNPIKVNFQTGDASTPSGYLADKGHTYANRGNGYSYGWSSDHTDVTRERNVHSDQRLDTLTHFHQGQKWQIGVPNGNYEVYVVIGDPSHGDTRHTLNVEGVNFWNDQALGANEFAARQRSVSVSDGKLTLTIGSAGEKQTKIAFIQILPPGGSPHNPINTTPVCDPELHLSGTIQSDNRTGRITNSSSSCSYEVGMASYRKFDEVIDNQEIYHSTTTTIGPNETKNLTVEIPGCSAQVDLFYGPVLQSLNGQRYGERLLAAKHINGSNYCAPPACPGGTLERIEGVNEGQNVSGVLNLRAITSGPTSRIVFDLSGPISQSHTENIDPYYFLGDTNGSPNGWNTGGVPTGNYSMKATRYATFGQSLLVKCDEKVVNFCVGCTNNTAQRVFVKKNWIDLRNGPINGIPANLPANYNITITSSYGVAVCSYPAGSSQLSCTYSNNSPATDNNGLWLVAGQSYTVVENNLPTNFNVISGTGTFTFNNSLCTAGFNGDANSCQHVLTNQAPQ
jgi:hypothetical protein